MLSQPQIALLRLPLSKTRWHDKARQLPETRSCQIIIRAGFSIRDLTRTRGIHCSFRASRRCRLAWPVPALSSGEAIPNRFFQFETEFHSGVALQDDEVLRLREEESSD